MKKVITISALLSLILATSTASAALVATDLGTAAPPGTLGGYPMVAFPPDPQPAGYTPVTSVATPVGGVVAFSVPLGHALTPGEWATWSHGYAGDIYHVTAGGYEVDLTLPVGTAAFFFYAEPNPFALHLITATAQDGTSLSISVYGDSGANGYGFHGTNGDKIVEIEVLSTTADFAIGEFGICRLLDIDLDIKPGSCPNPLNVKSEGVLPVAILGTDDLDVTELDISSLRLRRPDHLEYATPLRFAYEDVATPFDADLCGCHEDGPDGILDLVLHFDTPEVVEVLGPVVDGLDLELILTGEDAVGIPIEGADCIRVIKKK